MLLAVQTRRFKLRIFSCGFEGTFLTVDAERWIESGFPCTTGVTEPFQARGVGKPLGLQLLTRKLLWFSSRF